MELINAVNTLKIITALFSIVAGTAAGLYFSYRLKKREESLNELTRALQEMALLIRYRTLPVNELFTELSRYEFIRNVGEVSKTDGTDFRRGWVTATDQLAELENGERSIIKSVGLSLGTSDVEGQLSMLEVNAKLLEKYGNEAREQYMKKGKLYRSFGVLAGIFIAILII